MRKILQIVFCVTACLLVASAAVVAAFGGVWWGVGEVLAAAICVVVMLLLKDGNPFARKKKGPDFMDPEDKHDPPSGNSEEK